MANEITPSPFPPWLVEPENKLQKSDRGDDPITGTHLVVQAILRSGKKKWDGGGGACFVRPCLVAESSP